MCKYCLTNYSNILTEGCHTSNVFSIAWVGAYNIQNMCPSNKYMNKRKNMTFSITWKHLGFIIAGMHRFRAVLMRINWYRVKGEGGPPRNTGFKTLQEQECEKWKNHIHYFRIVIPPNNIQNTTHHKTITVAMCPTARNCVPLIPVTTSKNTVPNQGR